MNVQAITGSKKDFTSLDLDCDLELGFAGPGKVEFDFKAGFEIVGFDKLLRGFILR